MPTPEELKKVFEAARKAERARAMLQKLTTEDQIALLNQAYELLPERRSRSGHG